MPIFAYIFKGSTWMMILVNIIYKIGIEKNEW